MQASSNEPDGVALRLGLAVVLTGAAMACGLILSDGGVADEAIASALLQDASDQLAVASAE